MARVVIPPKKAVGDALTVLWKSVEPHFFCVFMLPKRQTFLFCSFVHLFCFHKKVYLEQ